MNKNLINRLQNNVRSQSVNSLGGVYPDDIVEWLGTTEKETKEFLKELHDERIVAYKYKLKCDCGETCTIYENKMLQDGVVYCEICGQEITWDNIREKAEIVYEIDKEELMNFDNETVDFREIPTNTKGKIVSMVPKQEEKKMEIFMGSSKEAKDLMEKIAVKLEELGKTPLLWSDTGKGIFPPGSNTIDALLDITKRVQAAVFIFNGDDKIWNEKSAFGEQSVVRDNVLLEYGLFVGALGKDKVCFVCKGKPKEVSDLKGVTYIDGEMGDNQIKAKLMDWFSAMK